MRQVIYDKPD